MMSETHGFIIDKAIENVDNSLIKEYKYVIRKAAIKTDKPHILGSTKFTISSATHYYNPETGKGMYFFKDAKTRGIKSFERALRLYKEGEMKRAFKALGKSLHYLADLGTPAHTILSKHYFNSDDLERYAEDNFEDVNIKIREIFHDNYREFFEKIAKFSFNQRCKRMSLFSSLFYFIGKRGYLTEEELKEQMDLVLSEIINYNVGLLKLFIVSVS